MFDLSSLASESNLRGEKLPLKDAALHYYPKFLEGGDATEVFQQLLHKTPWQEDDIKVFGKIYKQPRLTALYGTNSSSYTYSGITMHPHPFSPLLLNLKLQIESISQVEFNTVLLNLYRDGQDSNGWHSDNEPELGKNPVIASLSLGAERFFHLKHRTDKESKFKLLLEHGSLLIMKGTTQHHWLHMLPKSNKIKESRINLTFRVIK